MRIIKRILLGLLCLIIISGVGGYFYFKNKFKPAPNQLTTAASKIVIPFTWQSDSINNQLNPYAAMLLPVLIKGCPRVFYMQFDLGAPTSLFYKNKLNAINDKFKNISLQHTDDKDQLINYDFFLDKNILTAKKIDVKQFDSSGINWSDTLSHEIIGTIGTDLFEDKILIINYQNNNLFIGDKIPDSISPKVNPADFKFENRRVLLPALIDETPTDIFFDSGTSAFELMTNQKTWEKLSKKDAKPNKYEVSSWGNKLKVNTIATDKSITFNKTAIPLKYVTYVEGISFVQSTLMKLSGVGGLTGNKLFINKIVVLDTKHLKFDIVE